MLYAFVVFFFCKQKTAYEMRISDWSSDVCSSDLAHLLDFFGQREQKRTQHLAARVPEPRFALVGSEVADSQESVIFIPKCEIFVHQFADARLETFQCNAPSVSTKVGHLCSGLFEQGEHHLKIGRAHVLTPVTTAHLVCR